MEAITALVGQIGVWHWLALGTILVLLEILTPTNYLLWPGLAAFAVGLVSVLSGGLGGDMELILFGVLAVISTIAGRRLARPAQAAALPGLNRRADQYVGRKASVAERFANGRGPVILDDTHWQARDVDGVSHDKGALVEITGSDGAILRVRKSGQA